MQGANPLRHRGERPVPLHQPGAGRGDPCLRLATVVAAAVCAVVALHRVCDVTYDEDRSQVRTGTGPQVVAALRNAAISVLRLSGITNIVAATRHHARASSRPLDLLKIG